MPWIEQLVRRYEHRRWAAESHRRSHPFDWGLEYIGGRRDEPDPHGFLRQFADRTVADSEQWFAAPPGDDYDLRREADGLVLSFTSAIRSPWPENNRVWGRYFPVPRARAAVVVLPQWNADWNALIGVCRWLNRLGFSALRVTLPYHSRRAVQGLYRDNFLVCPNIGLTLQANRQAVVDVRQCLRWLEQQGYQRLGILGTSIGSAIGFIVLAHDRAVRSGVFLHVSTYFGDVVRTGLTTIHVWEPMRPYVTAEQIRHYWSPISPFPYLHRLSGTGQRCLMISGQYDPTFRPEFSEELFRHITGNGVGVEIVRLPCGHYSLDRPPFSLMAGWRFGRFLRETLGD
jgi:hypothetical protein